MSHPDDILPDLSEEEASQKATPDRIRKFLNDRRKRQLEGLQRSGILPGPSNDGSWIGKRK